MSKKQLSVRLNGLHIGILEQTISGKMIFSYDKSATRSISIGMPIRLEPYDHVLCEAFFGGLLPESTVTKKIIGKRFNISPNNSFALLRAIGHDCAGAISFHETYEPEAEEDFLPLEVAEISEHELYEHIKNLPKEPLFLGFEGVRLSLAGAHDKAAVCMLDNRILLPTGACPTTHILKPAIPNFLETVENEYFCLRMAKMIGLSVPAVEIRRIKDISFLLIERYDRVINGNHVKRIHQEDFCQALGIVSIKKYQNEGGPGFKDCFTLLNEISYPIEARNALISVLIYNFLVSNMDAHGKNFSLLHSQDVVKLAPFYDIVCTGVYESISKKMAMKIGSKYTPENVLPRHWEQLCNDIRYSYPALKRLIKHYGESILKAAESEKLLIEKPNIIIDNMIELWKRNITHVLNQFE